MTNQFGMPTTKEIFDHFETKGGYVVMDILEEDDGENVMFTVQVLHEVAQMYYTYIWEEKTREWKLEE